MTDNQRIVIKIGTSTLTGGSKNLKLPCIISIVQQISALLDQGRHVVLVSSGAIAAGQRTVGISRSAKDHSRKADAGSCWSTAFNGGL